MRHRNTVKKLSRPHTQRKALEKSLLRSVILAEKIKTTSAKAKLLKPEIDKLIVLAKKGTLSARRQAYKKIGDHKLVKKLFDDIAPRFTEHNSGFSRLYFVGYRKGDGAKMALFALTQLKEKETSAKKKKEKKQKLSSKEQAHEPNKEKKPPKKEKRKGLVTGIRKIFKKERDSL